MDINTCIVALATLISGLLSGGLIIANEWGKRWLDNNHNKKKLDLWKEVYDAGPSGLQLKHSKRIDLLYDLLKDGLVELNFSVGDDGSIIWAYTKGLKPSY